MTWCAGDTESISTIIMDSYWISTIRTSVIIWIIVFAIRRQFEINNLNCTKVDIVKIGSLQFVFSFFWNKYRLRTTKWH